MAKTIGGKIASVIVDTSGLTRIAGQIDKRAADVIAKNANDIMGEAVIRVPVDTGNLKNTIYTEISNGGATAQIGASAEYAVYVEFGTGQRGAASPINRPEGIEYSPGWMGMTAKPYLIPALEKFRQQFLDAWKELTA